MPQWKLQFASAAGRNPSVLLQVMSRGKGSLLDFSQWSAIAVLTGTLLGIKLVSKWAVIVPLTRAFAIPLREGSSIALLMSTGLTFGTVTALAGLTSGIIDQQQYAALVTTVIASGALSAFAVRKLLQSTGSENPERSAEDSS
jgi:Kef-type K+ transport system membrane component KefB